MFDYALTVYDFNLAFAEQLLSDIPPERMAEQPLPGMNTPAWIIGHLAMVNDTALPLAGRPVAGRHNWEPLFGAGTPPTPGDTPFPTKNELLTELRASHAALAQAVRTIDPALLSQPNPVPFPVVRRSFPTVGEMLAQLLTGHYALHLGQISAWRRAAGWTPLF